MHTKLLIAADDFTGGLDTGVQLARQGISTHVVVDPGGQKDLTRTEAQVVVVVSETRHLPPERAYDTVYRIVARGKQAGIPYVYKKTDSALRGNIGAELAAAWKASGADVLSFLPAYPVMDRITVGGCQYIDGLPVAQSVFGQDPLDPVTESDIRKLIQKQTNVPVIPNIGCGCGILVVDAQKDEDLRSAGRKLADAGALSVSAGCAGFAAFLPELLGLTAEQKRAMPSLGSSLLVISGSLNPITLEQLDYAENHGFERIGLDPEKVPDFSFTHGWTILDSSRAKTDDDPGALLAEALAKAVRTYTGTVMIIGGDTLLACLSRLGCRQIEPIAELFPGVVLSQCSMDGQVNLIISKSGGFGDTSLLSDLRSLMERQSSDLAGG